MQVGRSRDLARTAEGSRFLTRQPRVRYAPPAVLSRRHGQRSLSLSLSTSCPEPPRPVFVIRNNAISF